MIKVEGTNEFEGVRPALIKMRIGHFLEIGIYYSNDCFPSHKLSWEGFESRPCPDLGESELLSSGRNFSSDVFPYPSDTTGKDV